MSESETSKPTTRRRPANDGDDPDPASVPSVSTRITAPFNIPTTGVGPSPSAIQREANKDFVQEKKNLGDIMSGLEGGAGSGRYQLHLMRTHPRVWRGKMIGGYVTEYPAASPPTNEDIKQVHGGGTYYWRVMIPNPRGGGAGFGPTTAPFDIAGDPVLPEPPPGSEPPSSNNGGGHLVEIAKISMDQAHKLAEAAERRAERMADANKGEGGSTMNALLQMQQRQSEDFKQQMLAAQQARDAELKMLQVRLDAQERERRAERDAAEARIREERLAAEAKAEREAKERELRWEKERDDANRRHAENLAAQKIAIEQARADADRRAKEAYEAAEKQRLQDERNFQLQLKAMETSADKQAAMMQAMQSMQLQQFKELDSMKMGFFEKQLSQKPSDPLDQIMKWKQVSDILSGKDDEEKEPAWKAVVDELKDGIREAGPSLMAMAGITNNAVEGGKKKRDGQERRQLKDGKRRRRVKPDTTVVVDLDEEDALPDDNEETHGLKELQFPEADELNPEVLGDLLVRNIEFALERDNNATWIVNNVIKRFPAIVIGAIKAQPTEALVAEIKKRAPATWRIVSPDGLKKLKEAHSILQKG